MQREGGSEPSTQRNRHTPGLSIQVQRNYPTPKARDAGGATAQDLGRNSPNLNVVVKWPTPRASDGAKGGSPNNDNLPAEVRRRPAQIPMTLIAHPQDVELWESLQEIPPEEGGGLLNPRWEEWLMGIPIGWLALEPLEMESYRQWWQSFCD